MKLVMEKYLKILAIELDDIYDDIKMLIDDTQDRREKREITNYVLLENLAVLKNEMCGVDSFKMIMNEINLNEYSSVEEFIKDIKARFKIRIEECGLAGVVYNLIERKLNKVLKYVTHK